MEQLKIQNNQKHRTIRNTEQLEMQVPPLEGHHLVSF